MLKPTKVKIVKKIYSFSPSREGCILVLRVEDVRSKQNEIGSIGEGVVFHEVLIDNSRRVQRRKKYYCLLPIASACAHTPTMYYVVMCARVRKLLLRKLSYYLIRVEQSALVPPVRGRSFPFYFFINQLVSEQRILFFYKPVRVRVEDVRFASFGSQSRGRSFRVILFCETSYKQSEQLVVVILF